MPKTSKVLKRFTALQGFASFIGCALIGIPYNIYIIYCISYRIFDIQCDLNVKLEINNTLLLVYQH